MVRAGASRGFDNAGTGWEDGRVPAAPAAQNIVNIIIKQRIAEYGASACIIDRGAYNDGRPVAQAPEPWSLQRDQAGVWVK
jgi:hypothetical protein